MYQTNTLYTLSIYNLTQQLYLNKKLLAKKKKKLGSKVEAIMTVFFLKKLLFIYLAALGLSCGMQGLVPWPRIEPRPLTLGPQSLSLWTTREVPMICFCEIHWYSDGLSSSCPHGTCWALEGPSQSTHFLWLWIMVCSQGWASAPIF